MTASVPTTQSADLPSMCASSFIAGVKLTFSDALPSESSGFTVPPKPVNVNPTWTFGSEFSAALPTASVSLRPEISEGSSSSASVFSSHALSSRSHALSSRADSVNTFTTGKRGVQFAEPSSICGASCRPPFHEDLDGFRLGDELLDRSLDEVGGAHNLALNRLLLFA